MCPHQCSLPKRKLQEKQSVQSQQDSFSWLSFFWRLSIFSEAAGGWMGPPLPFVKWSDGYFFISSRARMQSLV